MNSQDILYSKGKNDEFIGKTFNRWTIIGYFTKNWKCYFKCKCSCEKGTVKNVLKGNILSNKSKSCGCISREKLIERNKNKSRDNIYEFYNDFILIKDFKNRCSKISLSDFETIKKHKFVYNRRCFSTTIKGKKILLHRLIMKVTDSNIFVDHINHDTLDNRRSNLRICSNKENLANSKVNIKNTSGHKGVSFNKALNKWEAYGTYIFKKYHLGYFIDIKDAIEARKKWENLYQKDFAFKNKGENI